MKNSINNPSDLNLKEFANKLRDLRHFNKKTQKEVASKFNISVTCYAGYEQGYRSPDLETLVKIANYYNVSVDYLLGRKPDPEKVGEIKTGYFFREYVGEGTLDDGRNFELCVSAGSQSPMILFGKRAFILSWNDICNLAERAGLFAPEE